MRPSVIMIGSLKWWNSAAPPAFHCQASSIMQSHLSNESTPKAGSQSVGEPVKSYSFLMKICLYLL